MLHNCLGVHELEQVHEELELKRVDELRRRLGVVEKVFRILTAEHFCLFA